MISDDLAALAREFAAVVPEPSSEPAVEFGPVAFRDRFVRGVPDELMPEPVGVQTGSLGSLRANELAADQRAQVLGEPHAIRLVQERRGRGRAELLALDGGPLEHTTLGGGKPVEPCREEGLDARRHGQACQVTDGRPTPVPLLQRAVVDQHRQHLLDEQGVALGRLGDPTANRALELRRSQKVLHEFLALRLAERLQEDGRGVRLSAAPVGSDVEQLRAGRADQQDRRLPRPVGDVLDEVEQCRLRPVDVVDHDDERAFRRERLEQSPGRPEQLLRRARGLDRPGEREQAIRGGFGLGTAPEQRDQMTTFGLRLDLRQAQLAEDLDERKERDALPVREAAPAQHGGLVAD